MQTKGLKEQSETVSFFFLFITLRICDNGFCGHRMSCMSGGVTEVTSSASGCRSLHRFHRTIAAGAEVAFQMHAHLAVQ